MSRSAKTGKTTLKHFSYFVFNHAGFMWNGPYQIKLPVSFCLISYKQRFHSANYIPRLYAYLDVCLIMHLINHVITYFWMVLPPCSFCFLFLPTQTWISSEQSRIASAELRRPDRTLVWSETRVCSKHYKLKFTAKLCYIQY